MGLEKIVTEEKNLKGLRRVMVTSDWHVPFIDEDAFNISVKYQKDYKPHIYVAGGDIVDFYTLSKFDKNPDRKDEIQEELDKASTYLEKISKNLPRGSKKYLLKGNHESRHEKELWGQSKNLKSLRCLKIEELLNLKKYGFTFIDATHDYWKNDSGHLVLGDVLLMHGDNRLNGATLSKYSGYSASNTVRTMMNSVIMGHGHRLATIYQTTPNGILKGVESGCLCQLSGTSNWQQGFVTFDLINGIGYNFRTHLIDDGVLRVDGKLYKP